MWYAFHEETPESAHPSLRRVKIIFSSWCVVVALSFGGVVFAHGGAIESDEEMRHPETQIGLPGSRMGHDDVASASEGLTRSEVSALIADVQATEERRSAIKIVLLFLAVVGMIYLYFPKSSVPAAPEMPAGGTGTP